MVLLLCMIVPVDAVLANSNRDRALIESVFASLPSSSKSQRQKALRQIALYPFSKENRQLYLIPELARVLLTDPHESVRRSAGKAIFSVTANKNMQNAMKVLLESNAITPEAAMDAIVVSSSKELYLPVLEFVSSQGLQRNVRMDALSSALELWGASFCDESLELYKKSFAGDLKVNPAFDLLKGKDYKTVVPSSVQLLEELAFNPPVMFRDLSFRAQLVLGCFENRGAIDRVKRKFFFAEPKLKLQIVRFFSDWRAPSTLATIGDCARNDKNQEVRQACIGSLFRFDIETASPQILRTYRDSDLPQRRTIVDSTETIEDLGERRRLLARLSAREKNESLLSLLALQLQKTIKP